MKNSDFRGKIVKLSVQKMKMPIGFWMETFQRRGAMEMKQNFRLTW